MKYTLEIYHNFGLFILYRPFLHYLAKAKSDSKTDKRQLRCAFSCINVAQKTIVTSQYMVKHRCLCPASWACVYTIFLSVVCLVFFLATHSDSQEFLRINEVAQTGVEILAMMSCQDTGAKRCLDVLQVLAHLSASYVANARRSYLNALAITYRSTSLEFAPRHHHTAPKSWGNMVQNLEKTSLPWATSAISANQIGQISSSPRSLTQIQKLHRNWSSQSH